MTKPQIFFLVIAALLIHHQGVAAEKPHEKQFDIKSGIVTYINVTQAGTVKIERKFVLSFDDYGAKQREDVYTKGTLTESTFDDGKTIYKIDHAAKTTYVIPVRVKLFDYRFDWNAVADSDKISGTAKELAATSVAGKVCASYEVHSNAKGGVTTYSGWNHILLLRDIQSEFGHNTTRALKIEEDVKLPANIFKSPAGYAVKKP